MPQDDSTNNSPPPAAIVTPSHSPESEPFRYHFDHSDSGENADIEHQEDTLVSEQQQTPNPYATTPITTSQIQNQPFVSNIPYIPPAPPLPLTDEEIEGNVHTKDTDTAMHWLALWCLRQLEIYENSLKKK